MPQVQLQEYAKTLQQTLVGALQSGCVTLLEIQTCDHVSLHSDFLPWYIREFWMPLVQQLPDVIKSKQRFIILCVVVVSTLVQMDNFDPELSCCDDVFEPTKLLSLPLNNWRKDEILNWLLDYARLDSPEIGFGKAEIEAIAEDVYLSSRSGLPALVPNELLKVVEKCYLQRSSGGIV